MGFFTKKETPAVEATEPERAPVGPTPFEVYWKRANEMPLLTAAELVGFAHRGETVLVSPPERIGWSSDMPTQFYVRLRRSLMAKFPLDGSDEYGALLQVAGAARTYRMNATLGRIALIEALKRLDEAQTPSLNAVSP